MNFEGIIIGAGAFIIIGVLHPVVIKAEYHFGVGAWPAFLVAGLACVGVSFLFREILLSALLAILGFSLLWGIGELFHQAKRVEKGWFPRNPKKSRPMD